MLLLTISAISISRLVGPLVNLALDCFGIGLPVANSLKRQKHESPNEQRYEIKQNERQPRRRLSHSVGPNARQNSDSAIKTPTGRPIPKQSSAKFTKGPTKREIEIRFV
jgi:hypothetical protein